NLGPLGRADLVGAEVQADVVVEHLGGCARERAEACIAEALEERADAHPKGLGTLPDLEGGEAVNVHPRQAPLDGLEHLDVEVAGEVGVDATLEAHLGGSALPRLHRAPDDLVDAEEVGLAAEVEAPRALAEAAEAAAEVAQVRVVDVAVDHIGHDVA